MLLVPRVPLYLKTLLIPHHFLGQSKPLHLANSSQIVSYLKGKKASCFDHFFESYIFARQSTFLLQMGLSQEYRRGEGKLFFSPLYSLKTDPGKGLGSLFCLLQFCPRMGEPSLSLTHLGIWTKKLLSTWPSLLILGLTTKQANPQPTWQSLTSVHTALQTPGPRSLPWASFQCLPTQHRLSRID